MRPFYFIQLADPQFGMYANLSGKTEQEIAEYRARGNNVLASPKIEGFERETQLFGEAISEANRLRPDFLVTCGDIINDWSSQDQADEAHRIAAGLAPDIPMYWVSGNHDLAIGSLRPTPETLARYREVFGLYYYTFEREDVSFIVLNTTVMHAPDEVPEEWETQVHFLESELSAARMRGSTHIIVLSHHPFFLRSADEDVEGERHIVIPRERRWLVLDLFERYGVSAVFAGHWHRNNYARNGSMLMVASGSVGYPLGDDPSGYRVVRVYEDRIDHDYYGFGRGPTSVRL